ncbi:hypothetical protein Tco_1400495 [Tanacetum coccineum]
MHTRSQSRNLHNQQHQAPPPVEQFNLEEPVENPEPLAPMDDTRTMAQFLEAPKSNFVPGNGSTLRFYTSAGNSVKEILLKLNIPDHRKLKDGGEVLKSKNFKEDVRYSDTECLSRSDEVLKLKNFKKDAT